jgi:hypothetical protein
MSDPTQLQQLAAEFSGSDLKSRNQGGQALTYVSIDATIRRLNDVLGPNWSTSGNTDLVYHDTGNYRALTELTLTATIDGEEKSAYGVGVDVAKDPDKAAKTALAEALKKAAHQLGVALYLWDVEARGRAQKKMALAKASLADLKKAVYKLGSEALGAERPTVAQVAKHFKVKAGDLGDEDVLRRILTDAGLL